MDNYGSTTYRIVMHYKRSARKPVLARGIPSVELAELFVKAVQADDIEFGTTNIDRYTIEED